MTRFVLTTGTLCGREFVSLASSVIENSAKANRAMAIFNAVTANGASPELLEGPAGEGGFPAGSGAVLYAALQTVANTMNQLAATMAAVDQG